ncbi:unnamed protein product [Paramecium primaurelia]|uniref:Uncharacterized protein n=1 Tax=Paramecium primaurelia TaxID=5886 RepID=A0A8S1MZQ7_PARPR|nr:unnamed protein product [Paramecium primaurelia]
MQRLSLKQFLINTHLQQRQIQILVSNTFAAQVLHIKIQGYNYPIGLQKCTTLI